MAIYSSKNLKGQSIHGTNVLEDGTIRNWHGHASGRIQAAKGNKCFFVAGQGWLNLRTFSGTIGSYTYRNLPSQTPKAQPVIQAPKAQVNNGICTVDGTTYVLQGHKWVKVNSQIISWLKQTLINA